MMLYLNLRKRGVRSGLLFLVSLLVIGVIVTKTWVPGKAVMHQFTMAVIVKKKLH
ncbi:MAG: hypothetical protein RQM92_07015 [Candidatus Syntrophopropionicum ammoniitolerans]